MPEEANAMGASQKTRTEDRIRLTGQQRLEQSRIIRGIVFKVGVLNDDIVADGLGDGGARGRALAPVRQER